VPSGTSSGYGVPSYASRPRCDRGAVAVIVGEPRRCVLVLEPRYRCFLVQGHLESAFPSANTAARDPGDGEPPSGRHPFEERIDFVLASDWKMSPKAPITSFGGTGRHRLDEPEEGVPGCASNGRSRLMLMGEARAILGRRS